MKLVLHNDSTEPTPPIRKKIAFYLQDGVEVLDFAGPMEVFSYAGYEVFTVSKTKKVKSQGILNIVPDYTLTDAPEAGVLAFFGGNSGVASKDPDVINWIKSRKEVEYYFSVCTGAFILAEAGLLKGKTATTFHDALDGLEKGYPDTKVLRNTRFVDNGKVITTAGISAGIDGALHLVTKLDGLNAARKAAWYMEYDKWVPGEGLILSADNPYRDFTDAHLQAYQGVYEFKDNKQIQLKINARDKTLYATDNDRKTPIFFIEENLFMTPNDDEILFARDLNNRVVGFKLKEDKGRLYQRIRR
ncbi:DJ-1/PfpI family protein [Flavitalea antarctica]